MLRAVAVLTLVWAAVASKPPSPTPAKTGQRAEQSAHEGAAQTGGKSNRANLPASSHAASSETKRPNTERDADNNGPSAQWWFNFLLVIFTAALAVLGLFQLLAFRRQAEVMHRQAMIMRRQLASMKTTGDDTHDLAIAATKTASAAQKSAETSSEQLSAIVNVARARLTVEHINALPVMLIRGPNTITVSIMNRGHTPAIEVFFTGAWAIAPKGRHGVDWSSVDPLDEQMQRVDVIAAGLPAYVTIELPPFRDEGVRSLLDGDAELYILGTASYNDVFQSSDLSINFTALWSPIAEKWNVIRQEVD